MDNLAQCRLGLGLSGSSSAVWETWVPSWVGKIPWRREQLLTPVFWPGEFHGLYSSWGHKKSVMTEQLSLIHTWLGHSVEL